MLSGRRSPSSIYRLLNDGFLNRDNYLRGGPGAWRVELHPEGQRPFVEWVNVILGPQGPHRKAPQPPPEPWAHIPEPLRAADGSEPFWSRYGRVADPSDPPLSDPERWHHVYKIVAGMMGCTVCTSPEQMRDLHWHIEDALDDVEAGARWDEERWNRNSVEDALIDMPCPATGRFLREMLDAGTVPADLVETVEVALAGAEDQAP
jgi:hypothetical protein